jgi:hypothetical protein
MVAPSHPSAALVSVEQQRAIAETQSAMVVARQYPRDPAAAMDRILRACSRASLAEQGLYSYVRGGTEITGPSIRLAEAIAQNWGNIQFGVRELEQRNGTSTVQTFCWDMETNTRESREFQVQHVRHTKKGSFQLEDPRDIYETVANVAARRLRACIQAVIPGDVFDAASRQCEITMKSAHEVTPERIEQMVKVFADYGVTADMLETRCQRKLNALQSVHLVQLRNIYNSLRDGMSKPSEWFTMPEIPTASLAEQVKEKVKERLKHQHPTNKAAPPEPPPPADNLLVARGMDDNVILQEFLEKVAAATMPAQMAVLMEEIPKLSDAIRDRADDAWDAKVLEIAKVTEGKANP